MRALREILRARHRLALLLVVLALAVKALVPAGFMVGVERQVLTIAICADASGIQVTHKVVVPRHASPEEQGAQHAKSAACPFTALAMAGTAGADPALLALALAFILAIGFAPFAVPEIGRRTYCWPPLRGPPAIA